MTAAGLARSDWALSENPGDPVDAAARAMALPPGPMLRVFLRLVERWGLERSETMALLGIRSRTTFTRWRDDPDGASLDLVTRERIGHVFGIQAACVTLFGEGSASDGWVKRPNEGPLFGGRTPISRMTSGWTGELERVRTHLQRESRR